MENLTKYDVNELSLRVFNDEYLYDILRAWGYETLKEELDHSFIYSPKQLKILINGIENE